MVIHNTVAVRRKIIVVIQSQWVDGQFRMPYRPCSFPNPDMLPVVESGILDDGDVIIFGFRYGVSNLFSPSVRAEELKFHRFNVIENLLLEL
jgi:hypothetical protein